MPQISTGFGFQSTAADVAEGIDLCGRRAVVTGGASELGIETARELARGGAAVTLAVRDIAAGQHAAASITAVTGNPDIGVASLDLADQESVPAFAEAWDGPLHLLVNNAGIMVSHEHRTARGWELQFAVNHLGHFALARALHRSLAAAGGARIVVISSSGHLFSPVVFDDIHFAFRPYDPLLAYAQSRTANVLFAVGATARWASDGITANALNPGATKTSAARSAGGRPAAPGRMHKTPRQAAATSVLLATSPLLEGTGGRYFNDCNEAHPVDHRPGDFPAISKSVARYALDTANADRLWETSIRLLA
jgi:NAD(P)-dependent dehydrogenase (short-subunit alcohol dehydrogenase family)